MGLGGLEHLLDPEIKREESEKQMEVGKMKVLDMEN